MHKYTFKFLALTETITFEVKSSDKDIIEQFIEQMLLIFAKVDTENEKLIVVSHQQNSLDLRNKINAFVDKFKQEMPQLNGVSAYFRKLQEGENFFFLPNVKLETIDNLMLYDYLRAESEGKGVDEVQT